MVQITLFAALESLVDYLNAKRINEYDQPGRDVAEEKGATFGKVIGIEETIGRHAINVTRLKIAMERVFEPDIKDDRVETNRDVVSVGSIVVVDSLYGEETFGIETPVSDGQRISSASPMGKSLLGRRVGDTIFVNGDKYTICKVYSAGKVEVIRQIELLAQQIVQEATSILSSLEKANVRGAGEQLWLDLQVLNLIDKIHFIEIVEDIYKLDRHISTALRRIKDDLSERARFPIIDLRKTSGFIHIMNKLDSSNER